MNKTVRVGLAAATQYTPTALLRIESGELPELRLMVSARSPQDALRRNPL